MRDRRHNMQRSGCLISAAGRIMNNIMSNKKKLTTNAGCRVARNQNVQTAGPRRPMLLQDAWCPDKGSGACGTFTVTHDITRYTKAKIFSEVGKESELFSRLTTVAGGRAAAGHWNHREDGDYDSRPGALFRPMTRPSATSNEIAHHLISTSGTYHGKQEAKHRNADRHRLV